MAYFRASIGSGGGGGGGFPYTKSGTLSDFTSANQTQSVNTGLSEVKYVYVEGSNGTVLAFAQLDMDRTKMKQVAIYGTGSTINTAHSGNAADGMITANSAFVKVSNISGGTITFKGGNSYLYQNVKWYAG